MEVRTAHARASNGIFPAQMRWPLACSRGQQSSPSNKPPAYFRQRFNSEPSRSPAKKSEPKAFKALKRALKSMRGAKFSGHGPQLPGRAPSEGQGRASDRLCAALDTEELRRGGGGSVGGSGGGVCRKSLWGFRFLQEAWMQKGCSFGGRQERSLRAEGNFGGFGVVSAVQANS